MNTSVGIERTSVGRRLTVSREIAAPPADVWRLFVDTERWEEWGPSVSTVDCDHRLVEDGTTGRIQVARGPWLSFHVSMPERYRWTWRVAGLEATGHAVTRLSDQRSRASFDMPLFAAFYAPVCAIALRRIERLATDESGV